MVANVDISETVEGHFLARLAAIAMSRVEDLHTRALAAETTEDAVALHAGCGKAERSARQTLALKLKFVCDHARAVREDERQARDFAPHREKAHKEAAIRRREDLRVRLERVAWDEVPDPDWHDEFEGGLHDLLDEEAELATFLEEDPDAQYERLYRRLGLGRPDEPEEAADPAATHPETSELHAVDGEAVIEPAAPPDGEHPDSS